MQIKKYEIITWDPENDPNIEQYLKTMPFEDIIPISDAEPDEEIYHKIELVYENDTYIFYHYFLGDNPCGAVLCNNVCYRIEDGHVIKEPSFKKNTDFAEWYGKNTCNGCSYNALDEQNFN